MPLLASGVESPVLVEVKSGETYNGVLERADYYMNLKLKDVVCTSADAATFQKMKECFIRGNSIKYIRFPKTTVEKFAKTHGEGKKAVFRGRGNRRSGRRGRSEPVRRG